MAQSNGDQEQQQLIAMLLQAMGGMGGNGAVPQFAMPNKKKPDKGASAYAMEKQCIDIELDKKHLAKSESCSVCLKKFKLGGDATMLDPCKHFFHDLCIIQWLKSNNTCPLCRKELLTTDYDYESQKWDKSKYGEDKDKNNEDEDDNNGGNNSYSSMYV
mmetsp:Transcript_43382/g.38622  ORF Transcript_43382/g.38622 Transcript_43382/m.38622 type:complete len:159 (-) Transcript_43382:71-547(-)